jgi:hypothetical protein
MSPAYAVQSYVKGIGPITDRLGCRATLERGRAKRANGVSLDGMALDPPEIKRPGHMEVWNARGALRGGLDQAAGDTLGGTLGQALAARSTRRWRHARPQA